MYRYRVLYSGMGMGKEAHDKEDDIVRIPTNLAPLLEILNKYMESI